MTAIEFNHVGKQYRLGLVSTGTLSHDLNRWWQTSILGKEDPYLKIGDVNDRASKADSDYVWALRDIDFKVEEGDVVGIIGKNGAGKSTLLKLLSKVTAPTIGTIRARGRIASLLEVGTGFHQEMTGRENIYMNGAILGMTRAEIDSKIDEIIDFSGCEKYIDTPVKRYSSGMTVRLGFAVAAFLEPEILVVDEVLAVGDAEFQKKAIGKMKDISQGQGRTVLFVSHNMDSIKRLCTKGVLLEKGSVVYQGTAHECVDRYISSDMIDVTAHKVVDESDRMDNGVFKRDVEFLEVSLLNNHPHEMATDEPMKFRAKFRKNANPKEFQCNMIIQNAEGVHVAFYTSELIAVPQDKKEFEIEITIPKPALPLGKYYVRFEAGHQTPSTSPYQMDFLREVLSFNISYVHQDKRDEYLYWEPWWGLRMHEKDEYQVRLIK